MKSQIIPGAGPSSSPQEEKQNEAMLHAKRQKIFLKVVLISLVINLIVNVNAVFCLINAKLLKTLHRKWKKICKINKNKWKPERDSMFWMMRTAAVAAVAAAVAATAAP